VRQTHNMKRLVILLALILVVSSNTLVQSVDEQKDTIASPSFPGGFGKLQEYIKLNLKYPEDPKKMRVEGTVFVNLMIDSAGAIEPESVKIMKGISISLDREAIRLVKESPRWIPGRSLTLNRNISVKYTLPIRFTLEGK